MKTLPTRVLVISMVVCAGSATAQDAEKPLLSGPEVNDTRPALVEDTFGDQKMGKARMGAMDAIPAGDLRLIMRRMNAPDADPALRLTEEQIGKIRELMQDFEQERRAYIEANREAFETLRQEAGVRAEGRERPAERGANRGAGRGGEDVRPEAAERDMREPQAPDRAQRRGRPAADRGPGPEGDRGPAGREPEARPTPEQEAARQRLREFMQAGPSTGDLQRRIFAELTPEQQRFVDDEVLLLAEERAQERDMAMLERKRRDRAEQAPGARPGQTPGAQPPAGNGRARVDWDKVYNDDGTVNIEALPERVRQRLENLSESDRKKAIEALKKRFEMGQRLRTQDEGL